MRDLRSGDGNEAAMSRGFRDRDHYKTAVFFHCGGLNLPLLPIR